MRGCWQFLISKSSLIIEPKEAQMDDDAIMQEHQIVVQNAPKQCHLPPEVWFELFRWLTRMQLGDPASLACRKFCTLARTWIAHEGHARVLPVLEFRDNRLWKSATAFGAEIELPIAEVEPPKNIRGFNTIRISFIDQRVFTFLRLIQHLFTDLRMATIGCLAPNIPALEGILPMLRDSPVAPFSLMLNCWFDHTTGLVQMFDRFGEVLDRKMHMLVLSTFGRLRLHFEAEIAYLMRWLTAPPLKNGRPRLLVILCVPAWDRDPLIGRIVEAFNNAEHPANFMVRFAEFCPGFAGSFTSGRFSEFSLENVRTVERLVMRQSDAPNGGMRNWFLRRYSTKSGHDEAPEDVQALEHKMLEVVDCPEPGKGMKICERQMIYLNLERTCGLSKNQEGGPSDLKRKRWPRDDQKEDGDSDQQSGSNSHKRSLCPK